MRRTVLHLMSGLIVFLLAHNTVYCQEYPAWGGYPPLYSIQDIAVFDGDIYCVTGGGMFGYDPETEQYTKYYKNAGIEHVNLRCIAATSDRIYIGYEEDGLWEFNPHDGTFRQILFPEYHLKSSENINGIAINTIQVKNDSILYVGHANGLDRLNLRSEELRAYTHLGSIFPEDTAVNDVEVFNDSLWVATPLGLAVADELNPNLEFADSWQNYQLLRMGVPVNISSVYYVSDQVETTVYCGSHNYGILRFSYATNSLQQKEYSLATQDIVRDQVTGSIWAAGSKGIYSKEDTNWNFQSNEYQYINALASDDMGRLWVGTDYYGLQCYTEGEYQMLPMESQMRSDTFYDLALSSDGVLWAATAYRDSDLLSVFQRFDGTSWSIYDLGLHSWTESAYGVFADEPNKVWVGSWGRGGLHLIQDDGLPSIEDDELVWVDPSQQIIRPTITNDYNVVTDIDRDEYGNLWVANFQSDTNHGDNIDEDIPTSAAVVIDGYPIEDYAIFSPEEDGLPSAQVMNVCATQNGWVWYGTYNRGIIAFHYNNNPIDKSNVQWYQITTEDGLLSTKITTLSADPQGNLWVGSEAGLNVIQPIGGTYSVETLNEKLENESRDITGIDHDANGNKWVGTRNGLLKLNAQNTLQNTYQTNNSGLYSDNILSVLFDDTRNRLWVGTDNGINYFEQGNVHTNGQNGDIHIYPNPFEIWGYDSMVTFTNLAQEEPVSIYSFDGVHIASVTPEPSASEVNWNGRNFKGDYVGSGVYFIVGTDSSGNVFRDKMIVMRR